MLFYHSRGRREGQREKQRRAWHQHAAVGGRAQHQQHPGSWTASCALHALCLHLVMFMHPIHDLISSQVGNRGMQMTPGGDWRQAAGSTAAHTLRAPAAPPVPLPPAAELGPAPSPLLKLPAGAQTAACRSRSSAGVSGQHRDASHLNVQHYDAYPAVQRPARSSRPVALRRASSRRPSQASAALDVRSRPLTALATDTAAAAPSASCPAR